MTRDYAQTFRDVAANMASVAESGFADRIQDAVALLEKTFAGGGKLLVFGNGGSSADAQHLVAELVGRYARTRRALPAIALTTNQALLTAWSNDRSFDEVFARQIAALGVAGDVAWGISTSGASRNVVHGLEQARKMGLRTIGLTGAGGAALASLCDVLLAVPLSTTARIQEVHLVTYHAICAAIEDRLPDA
jgi:D-sedoheptulose 7-phosphate isomerase